MLAQFAAAVQPPVRPLAEPETTQLSALVTRRRHRDDLALTADGPDADEWLNIAQAFAGPPGTARAPLGAR